MMLGDYLTPGGPGDSLRDGAPQRPTNLADAIMGGMPQMGGGVPGQMMQQKKPGGPQGGLFGLLPGLLSGGGNIGLSGLIAPLIANSNTGFGRNFKKWLDHI